MTDPRIDAALLAVEHVQRRLHALADGPGYTVVPWQTKRSARRLSKMLASILPGLLELSDQAEEITAYAEAQPSEDAQPAKAHAPKSPRDLLAAILANPTHVPPFIADLVQQAIDALDAETFTDMFMDAISARAARKEYDGKVRKEAVEAERERIAAAIETSGSGPLARGMLYPTQRDGIAAWVRAGAL